MDDKVQYYVLLNPMIAKMAQKAYPALLEIIKDKGYIPLECVGGDKSVLEEYGQLLLKTGKRPVIDSRCPTIVKMVREKFPDAAEHLAPIRPILVACIQDLYESYIKPDLKSASLTVVTPCLAMNGYAAELCGDKIRFVTWRQFASEVGLHQGCPRSSSSPIPLGFFDALGVRIKKASGEIPTLNLLHGLFDSNRGQEQGIDLLELLYCEDGCCNGDGL